MWYGTITAGVAIADAVKVAGNKKEKAKRAGKGFPALCFFVLQFRYSVFSLILFWNRFRI